MVTQVVVVFKNFRDNGFLEGGFGESPIGRFFGRIMEDHLE